MNDWWVIGAVVVLAGAIAGCDIGASQRAMEASRRNAPAARRVWEDSRQRKWDEYVASVDRAILATVCDDALRSWAADNDAHYPFTWFGRRSNGGTAHW